MLYLSFSLQRSVMIMKMMTFPPLIFSALLATSSSRLLMRELIDHSLLLHVPKLARLGLHIFHILQLLESREIQEAS